MRMSVVIGLSDISAISVIASGRGGAALARVSQDGFAIARGFVITTEAFDGVLSAREASHACLSLIQALKNNEEGGEAREGLLAAMSEARLRWDHEMEIIQRFREMGGMVTLRLSTISGKAEPPLHAVTESGLMGAIRRLFVEWARGAALEELQHEFPAIIVQEVIESESSVEIKRKNDGFSVRAVFGQPEGLQDPGISSDRYHFDLKLTLTDSEEREQRWQHIPTDEAVEKVEVWEDFRKDPKLTPGAMDNITTIMSYMLEHPEIEAATLMVTDEDEIIIDDIITGPVADVLSLSAEPRRQPRLLMPEVAHDVKEVETASPPDGAGLPAPASEAIPVSSYQQSGSAARALPASHIRVKIYAKVLDPRQLPPLSKERPDGVILLGNWHEPDFRVTLTEIRRLLPHSEIIVELPKDATRREEIIRAGTNARAVFMLPPCRTLDDLREEKRRVGALMAGAGMPGTWAQVVYPGNLFFFEGIAGLVDAVSVDLERLARHLTGTAHEPQRRVRYDSHSFNEALGHMLASAREHHVTISVHSPDLVSVPGLLESLIRRHANILCASPGELSIMKKIVASVEQRMLRER